MHRTIVRPTDTFWQELHDYAFGLPGVTEDQPFGPDATVYRVVGRFAILQPDVDPPQVTLKCEPSLALELRAQYPAVLEGYHVNKMHWNRVLFDGSEPLPHSPGRIV